MGGVARSGISEYCQVPFHGAVLLCVLNNNGTRPFLHSLINKVLVKLLNFHQYDKREMVSQHSFNLFSLILSETEYVSLHLGAVWTKTILETLWINPNVD